MLTCFCCCLCLPGVFREATTEFSVDARALTKAGGSHVKTRVSNPSGNLTESYVQDNGDGTYNVEYTPYEDGKHYKEELLKGGLVKGYGTVVEDMHLQSSEGVLHMPACLVVWEVSHKRLLCTNSLPVQSGIFLSTVLLLTSNPPPPAQGCVLAIVQEGFVPGFLGRCDCPVCSCAQIGGGTTGAAAQRNRKPYSQKRAFMQHQILPVIQSLVSPALAGIS